jgi:hypothetical protein
MVSPYDISRVDHIWCSLSFRMDAQVHLDEPGKQFCATILRDQGPDILFWFIYYCLETRCWIWVMDLWTIPYRMKLRFCANLSCTLPLRAVVYRWEHFCLNAQIIDLGMIILLSLIYVFFYVPCLAWLPQLKISF